MLRMCTARAGSLNALGAVAGAGANVILGVLDMKFFDKDFFDEHIGEEDGRTGGDGSDGGAVAGKNACERNIPIGPGDKSQRDVVEVSRAAIAVGVVVTAAFGGRGTI